MNGAIALGPFKSRLIHLSANRLLCAGMWLTAANVLAGLLGYAYQVLMGRLLTPGDFALFSTVMALSMFLASPLSAMFMAISRRVSTLRAHGHLHALRNLYWRTHGLMALAGLVGLVLVYFLAESAQAYLRSPTAAPVWIFAGVVALGALLLINNAFFQGVQRFGWLGGSGVLGVALKIVFGVSLVALGLGVSGALMGVLIATLTVWLLGLIVNARTFPARNQRIEAPMEPFPARTVLPVLVANVAFAAMTQLDMVLVNRYFPPGQAGLYAAASVLGKGVLYLPGGLVMALYPMVADNHARDRGSAHILVQAVAVTATLSGLAALGYWLLGEWLMGLLYGPAYAGAGELLRWYGFAILPITLVMVAEYFLIAKGRVLFAWLFLAMAPMQILAIHLWHDHLWMIIAIMGLSGSALVALGYGMLWNDYRTACVQTGTTKG